jgi:hypothetical protein
VAGVTTDGRRGSYPVRVSFDERGWTGWIELRTGQELSIQAHDLAGLGSALTELVAVIDGADPETMTVEPTWSVAAHGGKVGLALASVGQHHRSPDTASFPRPDPTEVLDTRAARRIVAAMTLAPDA